MRKHAHKDAFHCVLPSAWLWSYWEISGNKHMKYN
ncbi:MAG: hypothetical protein ACI8U1_002856 [Rheinheimera aquimaris]|jgi:hypothetical protein